MSLAVFVLTALIVGSIAKALVAGRDLGLGQTMLLGAAGQVGAWLALHAAGAARYGQPWSWLASIAIAAFLLSLYDEIAPTARPRGEIEPPVPVIPSPSLEDAPSRPAARPSPKPGTSGGGDWAAVGAMLMGLTGFLVGFYGPMHFQPWANQGPMVGLFVTGPGGALLGAIVGAVLRLTHPAWTSRKLWWMLASADVVWGLFVLDLVVDRTWWH